MALSIIPRTPYLDEMDPANLQWKKLDRNKNTKSISTVNSPFKSNGGIKFIGGDIAEGLIKISALKMKMKLLLLLQKYSQAQEAF